jgi:hypothetical protein
MLGLAPNSEAPILLNLFGSVWMHVKLYLPPMPALVLPGRYASGTLRDRNYATGASVHLLRSAFGTLRVKRSYRVSESPLPKFWRHYLFEVRDMANTIKLTEISRYTTGVFNQGAAEISAYDSTSKRHFLNFDETS